ncbi:MAG TPA: hypothetical protein VMD51_04880, partial [Mycobacterium sp.]|nr:hypothetical protein [Mycobacterium sp.]
MRPLSWGVSPLVVGLFFTVQTTSGEVLPTTVSAKSIAAVGLLDVLSMQLRSSTGIPRAIPTTVPGGVPVAPSEVETTPSLTT